MWALDVELDAPRLEPLERLLSGDEIARAGRFHFEQDRARFVAGRGLLRTILGRYAALAPESLQFSYSPFGKPSLALSMGMERLRFNATGSEALALVALRLDAEVGIDVEQVRNFPDALAVAKRLMTVEEHEDFAAIPDELRDSRFLECWVRKEALVKSLGKGLRQSLDSFSLDSRSGEAAQRVAFVDNGRTVTQWVIPIAAPRKGFVAALATSERFATLKCWSWNGPTRD